MTGATRERAVGFACVIASALAFGVMAILALLLYTYPALVALLAAWRLHEPLTRASTLSTIEPAFTVLLAAVVLAERVTPIQLAGGMLILAAVVLLARAAEPDRGATTEPA